MAECRPLHYGQRRGILARGDGGTEVPHYLALFGSGSLAQDALLTGAHRWPVGENTILPDARELEKPAQMPCSRLFPRSGSFEASLRGRGAGGRRRCSTCAPHAGEDEPGLPSRVFSRGQHSGGTQGLHEDHRPANSTAPPVYECWGESNLPKSVTTS